MYLSLKSPSGAGRHRNLPAGCTLHFGFACSIFVCLVCSFLPERWCLCLRHVMWHLRAPQDPLTWTHSKWRQVLAGDDHPKVQISTKEWHRIFVGQNEMLWKMYFILCSDHNKFAHDNKYRWQKHLTSDSHFDLHWVHPPQHCALPCPGCCCRGKVSGVAAGRTAWGKHSATTQKMPLIFSFYLSEGATKEGIWCLDSHQHMECGKQVVHREVR